MTIAAPGAASGRGRASASSRAAIASKGWIPASVVMLGVVFSLTALSWDVQWHVDVGPDTFFTLPHLFLYAGSALAGLASLAVVLSTTAAHRAGRPVDPSTGGQPIAVFGKTFQAPVGYLISGAGAAGFLLYGLADMWWHSLYGFDAVIESPPHIGLLLSISFTMVGVVVVFATAWKHTWGKAGVVVAAPVMTAFTMVSLQGLNLLSFGPFRIRGSTIGEIFLLAMVTVTVVVFVRSARLTLAYGLAYAGVQAVLWWFTPAATRWYADVTGLPLRDFVGDGGPVVPGMMAMSLLPVALVVHAALSRAPRAPASLKRAAPLVGALAGLLLAVGWIVQSSLVWGAPFFNAAYIVLIASSVVLGALAGHLGRGFGLILRHAVPTTAPSAEGR
ncbi:hypothetical protein [Sinosporangium siamense]|uniref:Uncharacterized protein n=1 Tax=Sinosporangium siamense TaxID=1367973 RepID=A0A919RRV9_9ACTN|nr:hypothetical protein [Sinosporangium siamense]GII97391.1 hypothetical protein Ssi02_76220 [Sinosporangium siamense]